MRININFELGNECIEECYKINEKISKITDNEIKYGELSCRPHITLLMGEIDEKDFDKVTSIVNNFESKVLDKQISFSKPSPIFENYIFGWVSEDFHKYFVDDCKRLLNQLKDIITPHEYLISDGTSKPHVTLGYTQNMTKLNDFFEKSQALPHTKCVRLLVSHVGIHGTALIENYIKGE